MWLCFLCCHLCFLQQQLFFQVAPHIPLAERNPHPIPPVVPTDLSTVPIIPLICARLPPPFYHYPMDLLPHCCPLPCFCLLTTASLRSNVSVATAPLTSASLPSDHYPTNLLPHWCPLPRCYSMTTAKCLSGLTTELFLTYLCLPDFCLLDFCLTELRLAAAHCHNAYTLTNLCLTAVHCLTGLCPTNLCLPDLCFTAFHCPMPHFCPQPGPHEESVHPW